MSSSSRSSQSDCCACSPRRRTPLHSSEHSFEQMNKLHSCCALVYSMLQASTVRQAKHHDHYTMHNAHVCNTRRHSADSHVTQSSSCSIKTVQARTARHAVCARQKARRITIHRSWLQCHTAPLLQETVCLHWATSSRCEVQTLECICLKDTARHWHTTEPGLSAPLQMVSHYCSKSTCSCDSSDSLTPTELLNENATAVCRTVLLLAQC
jgi:hypothetical protein